MSPARARAMDPSEGPPLPNATWAAFDSALSAWRSRLPSQVTAATMSGKASSRQVVSTLHALGLLEDNGRPTMTLRSAVADRSALLAALRARWPELIATLERGATPQDVTAAFRNVPAPSAESARRFRTFVISACASAGVSVEAYRRLGSAASPTESRPRGSGVAGAARHGSTAAGVQLRRELARYDAAVDDAIRALDPELSRAWSQETARLRDELRREG